MARGPGEVPLGRRWYIAPLQIFVFTRLALFFLTFASTIMLPLNPLSDGPRVLPSQPIIDGWFRWDGLAYTTLADEWYWVSRDGSLSAPALLPLYPFLVLVVGKITDLHLAALLVSNIAFAGALVAVYRLILERSSVASANLSLLLIAVFPYSYVFAGPYPHSLALLLAALALMALSRKNFGAAWLFAALSTLNLPVGLAIIPPFLIATARHSRFWTAAALLTVLPALIFAVYANLTVGYSLQELLGALLGTRAFGMWWATTEIALFTVGLWLVAIALCVLARASFGASLSVYGFTLCLLAALAQPGAMGPWLALALPAFAVAPRYLRSEIRIFTTLIVSAMSLAFLLMAHSGWYPVNASNDTPLQPQDSTRLVARLEARDLMPRERLLLAVEEDLFAVGYELEKSLYRPGETLHAGVYFQYLTDAQRIYLLTANVVDREWRRYADVQISLPATTPSPGYRNEKGLARFDIEMPIGTDVASGAYNLELRLLVVPPFSSDYEQPAVSDESGLEHKRLAVTNLVIASEGEVYQRGDEKPATPLGATLGDTIELLGQEMRFRDDGALEVSLYWSARQEPAHDYTVFVQALDPAGRLVAQSDQFPMGGRFATTRLRTDTVIKDTHILRLAPPLEPTSYKIIAGMYDLPTGERLPVKVAPSSGLVDHLEVGTVEMSR